MKRLIVMCAAVAAGCSAQRGDEALANASRSRGYAEIARFSGEIDAGSGTFVVQGNRSVASSAIGTRISQRTDVTVSNAAPAAAGTGCPAGAAPWGAPVTIAPTSYDEASQYYDVFAEITTVAPTTGYSGCNSATAPAPPPVITATYGLWYYPSLNGPSGQTVQWWFGNPSAGKTTFQGRVMASKAGLLDLPLLTGGTRYIPLGPLVAVGDSMLYGTTGNLFAFLDGSGNLTSVTATPTVGPATNLVTDSLGTRVWFGGDRWDDGLVHTVSSVAFMSPSATGVQAIDLNNSSPITPYVASTQLTFMAVGPSSPAKAWFATLSPTGINSATYTSASSPPSIGTAITYLDGIEVRGLEVDASGKVYVSRFDIGNWSEIRVYDSSGTEIDGSPVNLTGTDCGYPMTMIYNPSDGKIWFAAMKPDYTDVVCTLNPANLAALGTLVLVPPSRAYSFAIGPDHNVWMASYESGVFGPMIVRGGTATFSALSQLSGTSPNAVAAGQNKIWLYDSGGMLGGVTMVTLTP